MTTPQILCVSANPAIDRRLRFPALAIGKINRAATAEPMPGGKAAHVAMAAHALSAKTLWLGFLGGATGEDFALNFRRLGIDLAPIHTKKPTRMNLELLEDSGRITEILEPGEKPSRAELNEIARLVKRRLRNNSHGAVVVISGSLPAGVPPRFYKFLIDVVHSAGSRAFLDTSGEALRAGIAAHPEFVKPNLEEAEHLLNRRLTGRGSILDAANELIRRGTKSASISLGAKGLVWLEAKNGPGWYARPPRMKAVSTVGCGDATVAGFAVAAAKGLTGEAAIRLATACGAANCLARFPARISARDVKSLMPQIHVRRIE